MIRKICIFDFDGTLIHTPTSDIGKDIWLQKTGHVFPYVGWWSKKESLDMDIFHIPVNGYVHKKYVEAYSDTSTITVLATGRLVKLKNQVEKILNHHDLKFDHLELNTGMETFLFKKLLFERLIAKYNPEVVTMYDDRHDHIVQFEKWARFQPCKIEIIDVTKSDKTPKIFN